MTLMAHLPHYAQLEEDFAGTAKMLQVLSAYYDLPARLAPTGRGERQYHELDRAVESDAGVKSLLSRLEAHYDTTYAPPRQEGTTPLSPEIERFLKGLDQGL